jgi:hypothetical protein
MINLPNQQWHAIISSRKAGMPTHMIKLFNIIETIETELGGELTAIQQYKIKQQARKLIAQGVTNEDDLAGEVALWFAAEGIC